MQGRCRPGSFMLNRSLELYKGVCPGEDQPPKDLFPHSSYERPSRAFAVLIARLDLPPAWCLTPYFSGFSFHIANPSRRIWDFSVQWCGKPWISLIKCGIFIGRGWLFVIDVSDFQTRANKVALGYRPEFLLQRVPTISANRIFFGSYIKLTSSQFGVGQTSFREPKRPGACGGSLVFTNLAVLIVYMNKANW